MSRSTLLVAVGATLGGVAVLMTALAAAYEPLLLFVAVPFAAAGYLIWFQGTGRLAARVRRRARAGETADRSGRAADGSNAGPRSDDPRWADPSARDRRARARRRAARASVGLGDDGEFDPRSGPDPAGDASGGAVVDRMSEREAYDVLEVEAGSDADQIRRAYRERVKETHPDTDGGDEERFKRVTEAYERLDDDR